MTTKTKAAAAAATAVALSKSQKTMMTKSPMASTQVDLVCHQFSFKVDSWVYCRLYERLKRVFKYLGLLLKTGWQRILKAWILPPMAKFKISGTKFNFLHSLDIFPLCQSFILSHLVRLCVMGLDAYCGRLCLFLKDKRVTSTLFARERFFFGRIGESENQPQADFIVQESIAQPKILMCLQRRIRLDLNTEFFKHSTNNMHLSFST